MTTKKTGHLMVSENHNNLAVKADSDWELNNNQKRFLEIAMQSGPKRTDKSMCEETGITPQTLCAWRKQPGFMAAWEDLPIKIIKRRLPNASRALMNEAEDGKVAAIKLALQAARIIGSGGVEVHVGDKIDKQLNVPTHLDLIPRASNMTEWLAIKKAMEEAMAEAEAEEAAAAKAEAIDAEVVDAGDAA